jgi:hypothetical protein
MKAATKILKITHLYSNFTAEKPIYSPHKGEKTNKN